ncbi:MAG: hypothetical protein PF448_11870 [Bacteroidales bacterium]|jgi:hypothetical protein|nr:hypothetical protein [Bacteroidales bacterium]
MTNENQIPDIVLVYPDEFLDELIKSEIDLFDSNYTKVVATKVPRNNTFMAFEWIIPTGFIIYILKPYLNSFLSEAGKDHYYALKKGLKKLIEKAKYIKAGFIAAKDSPEKLSKDYSQSIVISIIYLTKDNRPIKLLFDEKLELCDWENAIDKITDLILENYESYPNDRLSDMIKDLNVKNNEEIIATINNDSKNIEFFDNKGMIKKYK